ncbi:hypothetical protein FGRMN_1229 [Fusarium graminum]|nr:hypothetical protein FGRMN_1229 [Fusarium graminum]
MSKQIPGPPGYRIIGNINDVDQDHPQESLAQLAGIYGPIFRLNLPSPRIFVASVALADELCDEKRFQKAVIGPLEQVRNAAKDGLFTAYPGEHNWALAHKILMPAFGPLNIRSMFGEMQDIVHQMIAKWARFGADTIIDVPSDFTKLTLDSIALCAMGERFNSFYHDDMHPFVHAMTGMLAESQSRSRRPFFTRPLFRASNAQYQVDIKTLESTARALLKRRRDTPSDKHDLLNSMINGKDPATGEQLGDDTIIRNMITFLIAGHETTSGLLSFLFYELLDSPKAMNRLVKEIDEVIGKEQVSLNHLSKLPYLEACLRETLRLHPTAPAFTLQAKGDQILGGEYTVKDGEVASILLSRVHRDPDVYGSDAEEFRPSRMLDEKFHQLPKNAWKPFGNGVRACIGRPFAWQEAILAVAMILQTFHVYKENPSYQLQIRTTLTIKPDNFFIRVTPRDPKFLDFLEARPDGFKLAAKSSGTTKSQAEKSQADADLPQMNILYGSNTGTCESLAQSLASAAQDNGFAPHVSSLDVGAKPFGKDSQTVIITASYEGLPPDNAAHFAEWLDITDKDAFSGARYAVFGVGNKEWHSTYQKVPTRFDDTLASKGATRLVKRAAVDVAHDNIFNVFDTWQSDEFWPALCKAAGKKGAPGQTKDLPELKVTIKTGHRSSLLRQDVMPAIVTDVSLLTKPGAPMKRHIAIRLPTGTTYRSGDYLAILPLNPPQVIHRVMQHFRIPWDATMIIEDGKSTSLPVGQDLPVHDILSGMVELSQPVTSRLVSSLVRCIPGEDQAATLKKRLDDNEFQKTTTSLLDLLEEYPEAAFPFGQFLAALPPMHLRQYSISSTPLSDPSVCTLTYTVLDAPAKGNRSGHRFLGVASTYMRRLMPGDHLQVGLRPSRTGFHLPQDDTKPIIMACAGTGLAPFHGFIAERALKKEGGQQVGPALLFYGCNSGDEDDMYRDEFDTWEKAGVVSVRRAYSAAPEDSHGCVFVQDRVWHDRRDVAEMYSKGAQVYMCGAGIVGKSVEQMFAKIRQQESGCNSEEAEDWVRQMKGERYWADVFA